MHLLNENERLERRKERVRDDDEHGARVVIRGALRLGVRPVNRFLTCYFCRANGPLD